ncbi:hypothetical protein HAPAU_37440 [Halalkalicoccus paucihalophilus]|uniref:Uncharacterized protein n=1 Tax=Halalkalicoccus paucihalophilus TaxID=1008153 RepID=A0A151A8V3_9EURY|nr:hypothetical protein [Halalkalicoccus paucihalophilus]KYH24101.1 hypothetical protein HAPAU_37440 [Halalkalicoccus paucihalophilus]
MVAGSAVTREQESLFSLPSHPVGYIAVIAAVITGVIHLILGPSVIGFSQTLGILFILNGIGFLGGVALYFSRYWRRELYLAAAGYALVTFLAFFFYGGFGGFLSAFYMMGSLNWNAVGAKVAELILLVSVLYLYANGDS